ncbi:hypothetical protein RB594_009900 [Gaeumannomyces avenae]
MLIASSLVLLATAAGVSAQYRLTRTYDRNNFFDQFYFRDAAYFQRLIGVNDPTNGFVEYVSASEATRTGLAEYRGNQIYVGADSKATVPTSGIGRKSVRLESKQTFDTGLLIADIQHMPGNACGVWPAFWSFNFAESPYSEMDILEGNGWTRQSANTVSLHTCGTCSFPNLQGPELRKDCDLHAGANCEGGDNPAGCGVDGAASSFGSGFNSNNGGVYATLLDSSGIKIWFFPRSRIPSDIASGRPIPSVAQWGAPQASFQSGGSCNVAQRFSNQTIIINTAFCGDIIYDWTEQTEGSSQCRSAPGGSCEAYVGRNPQAYAEAYWLFNSIKLYQQ